MKNYGEVFREIHENRNISKQQLATNLNLSLPTVSQNLEQLLDDGLIVKKGLYESTGGRPASAYAINEKFRVSVGVEILPGMVNISLVDLYGNEFKEETVRLTFCPIEKYYKKLGDSINSFISKNVSDVSSVLGVDFAIPGIIAEDGEHIMFAEVLKSNDIVLSDFSKYVDFPCGFYHDAEANTEAELWLGEKMENAHYFFLNKYFCNALVLEGRIRKTRGMSSGTLEHLTLHTNGKPCYCGKKGCVDAYCSALSLMEQAGVSSLDDFFMDLRSEKKQAVAIWENYLDNLALVIDNARMVLACDIVISGLVQQYMTQTDINRIKEKVLTKTTFKNSDFVLRKGICGKNFTGIGATIPRISEFISGV